MFIAALLILAGVIHVLPLSGVMGQAALSRLYGVEITDTDLLILMQHRAVLFALLGGIMILSAFVAQYRPLAIAIGLISTVSFLAIALGAQPRFGPTLRTVVIADVLAIVALSGAALLVLTTD